MQLTLQRLIDREEIHDVMLRYARGVDRGDWDAVRAVYHEGAFDDHGDYKGDVEGFIEFARDRVGPLPQCMHFLGNCLIEFASDDVAAVETYFMTARTLDAKGQKAYGAGDGSEPVQLSSYGRYVDRIERQKGVWRIAHRIVVFEATRVHTGKAPPIKAEWAQLQRGPDDPIYQLRAAVGLPD
jgi:3-phenylpropionate/cinnamic acid dioxygenase small subunit